MVLKTLIGHTFNPDKIWGIEWKRRTSNNWTLYTKYTSQYGMLQALRHIKENEKDTNWDYRPIHIYYTWELENLDTESKRILSFEKLEKDL